MRRHIKATFQTPSHVAHCMAVFKGSLIISLFWLRLRKRVRRGYNAPKLPDDLSQCTLARPGQRLFHSKVADYRKRHPLLSNRSQSHRAGKKERKWGLSENELFVTKNCCITKEPVLGRKRQSRMAGSLSKRLYVARTVEELGWMRSTMTESYHISSLSQFVNSR